ncbi:MAG: FG-GAP-like repeat-containing protein, partial [Actinomycetota bacterium]|nr:FG-GAP-like repeat-containing protein [Actinomycetota bacterium]
MRAVRPFVLSLCVAAAAIALGAPSAFGATPSTAYTLTSIDTPFPQPTGRFAERHAATDDIDRDGVNDYFVGAPSETVGGINNAGRVHAISGRTRAVMYDIESPEIQLAAQFGFFISILGDVDNDGRGDIAIGTDAQDTTADGTSCTPPLAGCNDGQGKAWVFSGGKRGRLLYAVNNPDPQPTARFGSRIGRAGDVTGDGVPESIMGASGNDAPAGCGNDGTVEPGCRVNQGQAYIFNGVTGAPVRTLNLPAADQASPTCSTSCGGFGLSVQGPGDVDGDGVTDQLVNASSLALEADGDVCAPPVPGCNAGQGALHLFSGQTGAPLARIDDPTPEAGATFGFQDAAPLSPGDVNGDGRADLFANGFGQDGPQGESQGRIWVFNGKATVENPDQHGVVLYEPQDPTPSRGGQCCFALAKTDYNKDGRPDLYVGQSPHHVAGTDQSGGTYVFDGRNGSLLKSLELPAGVRQPGGLGLGSNLGWSVAAPGDLNRDGEPDYLAGAPFQDVGASQDEGKGFVFLSKVPPSPPPQGGGGGSAATNCPSGTSAGVSCQPLPGGGRRITGTPGNDTIVGTAANDIIR